MTTEKIEKILSELTFEEKTTILTGAANLRLNGVERLGIEGIDCADGPHGTRLAPEKNCTHFPNLCTLGSTWSVETARKMGAALADECRHNGIALLLGPGVNIKRHILCGRNFEYLSEDPVLAGELAAGYINGLQENGVACSLKHFAMNNQETYRERASVEADERTMREIYLKPFEIAVKKSKPDTVMCSYNKIGGVWASENRWLLTEILKEEWGYGGVVVSDWGAVHDAPRAVAAGLDLHMPRNRNLTAQLKAALDAGRITMEMIDDAARRVLALLLKGTPASRGYDRDRQHTIAKEIAADGTVLLKNNGAILPLTAQKYKKIAVIGEYAVSPLVGGQGSAEVLQSAEYTDSPLEELKKRLPGVEIQYLEMYKKREYSAEMLWPKSAAFAEDIADADLVLFFMGAMESEDTEKFDRRSAYLNQNFEMFLQVAERNGKKTAVVLQNGGALIFSEPLRQADAIIEMWLGGEAAGGAIADVLTGIVNPSGKLSETFPTCMRRDLEYPGNGMFIEYKERLDVGYRYYDKHPEEILYPFGHGLSYTTFAYDNLTISDDLTVSFTLTNTGETDGAEVVQLYVGDPLSTVPRPIKELKKFEKIFLKAGEARTVTFKLSADDLAYYNICLHDWVAENGRYDVYVGSSSRDIRLKGAFMYNGEMPYTMTQLGESMIG
ncbi:MAG: glycoside hydrolase family 3 C-terminal domain-containing protein [Clostridia bacterium]|nr:glycoside hydrolase family 3 C-terminal domain-containing protein [Clostridia bacterium]